jgi:serine/threonine protein kinase
MTPQSNLNVVCVGCGKPLAPLDVQDEGYVGHTIAGKYVIKDFIDKGGMGEVYLAVNPALEQRVAVKFLKRKFISDEAIAARFINEARSYARVSHPNAVTLLEYGQHDDGALYIITEFIDGESLTKTLKRHGPLPFDKVISIGKQLCEVLAKSHSVGVIHRDLKPDNVMLVPGARGRYSVKVLDFGIAKITDATDAPQTQTGAIFGTPEFMSPEQSRGDGATTQSDLYALGILMFYALTGKLPFSGKNKFAILHKHINDAPPRPTEVNPRVEVPAPLEALILKCLNKEPEQRYADAEDLYEALEEVRDTVGISATSMTMTSPSNPVAARDSSPGPSPTPPLEGVVRTPEGRERDELFADLSHAREEPRFGTDPFADPHADTIDPSHAPADLMSLGVEGEADFETRIEREPRVSPTVLLVMAVVFVGLGVVIALALRGPEPADGAEPDPPSAGAADETPGEAAAHAAHDMLAVGQVLGMLAAAEQQLDDGDLDGARQNVTASRMWLDDVALPERGRARRDALQATIEELTRLNDRAERLEGQRRCAPITNVADRIAPLSPKLAGKWRARADACRASKQGGEDRAEAKTPPAPKPPRKDPVAKKPAPKPDPTPAKPPAEKKPGDGGKNSGGAIDDGLPPKILGADEP